MIYWFLLVFILILIALYSLNALFFVLLFAVDILSGASEKLKVKWAQCFSAKLCVKKRRRGSFALVVRVRRWSMKEVAASTLKALTTTAAADPVVAAKQEISIT